ncbi:TetR family transcriptional regulator [Streptomyces sp. NPDC059224]|uniref:TetR family transcriptional regulator n=1 Tax=Streptomyces sp. NPDC059224 TaxID=3346775 RepID=UPI0036D0C563
MTNPPKPPRRQQLRAIHTRERILDVAGQLFVRDGYRGASLTEICTRAQAPKASLYRHFPEGKFSIAKTIMTDTLSMDGLKPQRLKLQEVVDIGMILAYRISNEDAMEAALKLSFENDAPETYGTPWNDWTAFNTTQLAEAQEQGELRPFVDLAEQADQLAGCWSGMVLMSKTLDRSMSGVERRMARFYMNFMDVVAIDDVRRQLDISTGRGSALMCAFYEENSDESDGDGGLDE